MNTLRSHERNGSIELLRFLFTTIIIFFHINLDLWNQEKTVAVIRGIPVTFFQHGNLGVEFFFLVSGYLMAETVCRQIRAQSGSAGPSLSRSTAQFVLHKAKAVLPFYLTACALTPLVRLLTKKEVTAVYFIRRLPSLFFLQRMGLGRPFIGCSWYLSSLFIALAAAYPLCRRFYRAYTHVIAPVLCAVLLTSIIVLTGSLGDISDWFFFTYKTNIRAFAELSMGAAAFELSRVIRGRVRTLVSSSFLSFTAVTCLALSLMYICSSADGRYGIIVFYLLFGAVVIAFSGEGIISRSRLFLSCRPFFCYLGRISLPMYLTQTLMRRSVPFFFEKSSPWSQCFLIYTGTLFLGMLLTAVMDRSARRGIAGLLTHRGRKVCGQQAPGI